MNLFISALLFFIAINYYSLGQEADSTTRSDFVTFRIGDLSSPLPDFCTGKKRNSKRVKACCAEILSESKIAVPADGKRSPPDACTKCGKDCRPKREKKSKGKKQVIKCNEDPAPKQPGNPQGQKSTPEPNHKYPQGPTETPAPKQPGNPEGSAVSPKAPENNKYLQGQEGSTPSSENNKYLQGQEGSTPESEIVT